MEENITAGDFLRRIREEKKELQIEVGKRFKKRQQYTAKLENGYTHGSSKNIDEIVNAYKLTGAEEERLRSLMPSNTKETKQKQGKRLETDLFYQLVMLSKDARDRIIKATAAYNSVDENNGDK